MFCFLLILYDRGRLKNRKNPKLEPVNHDSIKLEDAIVRERERELVA